MLADSLLYASSIIVLIGLADVILSTNQRTSLAAWVTNHWYMISSLKDNARIVERLRTRIWQRNISMVFGSACALVGLISSLLKVDVFYVFVCAPAGIILALIGPWIIRWAAKGGTFYLVLVRLLGLSICALFIAVLGVFLVYIVLAHVTGVNYMDDNPNPDVDRFFERAAGLELLFLSLAVFMLLPYIFIVITIPPLFVIEITIRRIAEHPKGPLLAIGAILGAVAAILKAYMKTEGHG